MILHRFFYIILVVFVSVGFYSCKSTEGVSSNAKVAKTSKPYDADVLRRMLEKATVTPLSDEDVDAYFLVGQQLLFSKNYGAAERILSAVFEAKPLLGVGLHIFEIRVAANKYDDATALIKRLMVLYPKNYEPAVAFARLQVQKGNIDDANNILQDALNDNPKDQNLAENYVAFLLKHNKIKEARKILEKFVTNDTASPFFLQKLAELDIKDKNIKSAKKLLNKLLRRAPENVESWTLAGFVAMDEGDYVNAEIYFREAYLKQPDNDTLAQYYCLQLLKQNKYPEARRLLLRLEKSAEGAQPLDMELTFQLAYVLFQLEEYSEAKKRFLAMAPTLEDAGRAYFYAGQCDELQKKYSEARAIYKRIDAKSAFNKEAFRRIIYLNLEEGLFEDVKVSMQVFKQYDDETDYRFAASVYGRLKFYPQAVAIAKEGLSKYPNSMELDFLLASWQEYIETKVKAIQAVEQHLLKYPKNAQALNYIAYVFAENNKNLSKAKMMIDKALQIEPKNGFFLDTLGWILFKQNSYSQAELNFLRALAAEPDEPVIYEHLGEVAFARKDFSKALKFFETAELKFASFPVWRIDNDPEWSASRQRVREKINFIHQQALSL